MSEGSCKRFSNQNSRRTFKRFFGELSKANYEKIYGEIFREISENKTLRSS